MSEILQRKKEGRKIVAVTAYDYPMSVIADRTGVDITLVGDSGGMVALGHPDTRPVTMDEMIMMASAVARGTNHALLVGDMPFMSYQESIERAIKNAGRFLKEGGMDAVKIEGGHEFVPTVRALARIGIPVMAHIGFTPQTTPTLDGYRVQGKSSHSAMMLLEDALALEEAGAFSLVLEMTTAEAAKMITESLTIPTIGIGAGSKCDGQILVLHDLLGLYERFKPKFAKRYANLAAEAEKALQAYRDEVISGEFPAAEHTFHMDPAELLEHESRGRREKAK